MNVWMVALNSTHGKMGFKKYWKALWIDWIDMERISWLMSLYMHSTRIRFDSFSWINIFVLDIVDALTRRFAMFLKLIWQGRARNRSCSFEAIVLHKTISVMALLLMLLFHFFLSHISSAAYSDFGESNLFPPYDFTHIVIMHHHTDKMGMCVCAWNRITIS